MASVVLVASISAENALASICPPMCVADIDEEEEAAAENATTAMSGNQTMDENITGTNSTS